ncbi:hypothetical protein FQN53_006255 [Emmonsiellopsis sp. PD_33]|nr:hypothetical protein FQN53_006255 [Emmonsiellopsis sp. PD_33]
MTPADRSWAEPRSTNMSWKEGGSRAASVSDEKDINPSTFNVAQCLHSLRLADR